MLLLALATLSLTLATPTSTQGTPTSAPSVNSTPAATLNSTMPTSTAGPGDALFTFVYQTCNHTFPVNDSRVCLTLQGHPGTLCRELDTICATGERVASSLHTWSDEHSNCSTYAWTWHCSGITEAPTATPTSTPTAVPTNAPTLTPTLPPSTQPPTQSPTPHPTTSPTIAPTALPTAPIMNDGDDNDDEMRLGIRWYWWVVIGAIIALLIIACVGYDCYKWKKEQQRVSPIPPGIQEGGGSRMIQNEMYAQPPPPTQPGPTVYVTHTIPESNAIEV